MEARICRVCILPDNAPGVTFNADGVCNVCEAAARTAGGGAATRKFGDERDVLEAFVARRRWDRYDCLCLYSGGKDSTYMLYALATRLKLRVLALTLDNWFISPQTHTNIRTTLQRLESVDHILFKPSWSVVRQSMQAGFGFEPGTTLGDKAYVVGHACLSCFGLITAYAGKIAIEKGIRNIVAGTTPGQMHQKSARNLADRYRSAAQAFRGLTLPLMRDLSSRDDELKRVFRISLRDRVKAVRLNLVPFYEHVRYDEARIVDVVTRELGWVRPRDTDSCSTNCQLNALGVYVHRKRYGLSPYVFPLAHDVRVGLMSREDALRAVNGDLNHGVITSVATRLGLAESLVPELLTRAVATSGPGAGASAETSPAASTAAGAASRDQGVTAAVPTAAPASASTSA
jgi:hypothetical protein